MKKLIALLLALVICTGILTGICFAEEKPAECTPELASIVVTHAADPTAAYYFDTLTSGIVKWACQNLEGNTTITLIKDVDLNATTSINFFTIPTNKDGWFGSKPENKALILDLGGNTLRHIGNSYLFKIERYGMTVKNGTIEYSGERAVFGLGTTTGKTATTTGTLYKPVLNLENVHVYNSGTSTNSYGIYNHIWGATINVKDSVLWTAKQNAISVSKTDQSGRGSDYAEYTKPAKITVNIENSTLANDTGYPIGIAKKFDLATDSVAVNVKDSTLVSNKGAAFDANSAAAFNTNGRNPIEQANWSLFLNNGKTASGTAYVYGVGSSAGKLPFTDVKESEWYYTFVRDLYNAKVISGMTETTFVPNGTLTYGQALKLITLAVGEAEQPAIEAHWASGYLNLAMSKGWLYDEVGLDTKITRLQFCQLAAAASGIVEQPAVNPFKDTQDGSVLALYHAGIINGMTTDTFSPNSSLTRAQISKIIHGIISH